MTKIVDFDYERGRRRPELDRPPVADRHLVQAEALLDSQPMRAIATADDSERFMFIARYAHQSPQVYYIANIFGSDHWRFLAVAQEVAEGSPTRVLGRDILACCLADLDHPENAPHPLSQVGETARGIELAPDLQ